MIEGISINLGGEVYVVPALNLKQIRTMKMDIGSVNVENPLASITASLSIVLTAIQRNYPDMTMDKLEEIVDMNNFQSILEAIMGQSGLVAKGKQLGEMRS